MKPSYRKTRDSRDYGSEQASSDRLDGHKSTPALNTVARTRGNKLRCCALQVLTLSSAAHRSEYIREGIYVARLCLVRHQRVSSLLNSPGNAHVMAASLSKGADDQKQVHHWAFVEPDVTPKSNCFLWEIAVAVHSCGQDTR